MGVNEIDRANTEKSFTSELAQSFSDSTRIMKRVFIVLAAMFVFYKGENPFWICKCIIRGSNGLKRLVRA